MSHPLILSRHHLIKRLRYLRGYTWEQICVKMEYSWKQIHRIHGKALKNFKMT